MINNILESQVNVIRYETGLIIRKEISTLLFLDDIITHLLSIFIHRQLKRLDIKISGINFKVHWNGRMHDNHTKNQPLCQKWILI